MGFRYVKNLSEDRDWRRIRAAREQKSFSSIQDFSRRTKVDGRVLRQLAEADARAYAEVVRCRKEEPHMLGAALQNACETPLSVAELAASIATRAVSMTSRCKDSLRTDLEVAAILGEAAASAALANLRTNARHSAAPNTVRAILLRGEASVEEAHAARGAKLLVHILLFFPYKSTSGKNKRSG